MLKLRGLFLAQYTKYTIANYVYMPAGQNKLEEIMKTTREEDIMGLLFPLLDYHDRWNDLTLNALRKRLQPVFTAENAGFMAREYSEEQTQIIYDETNDSYFEESVRYLQEIANYCKEEDIKLYLFLAPTTQILPPEAKTLLDDAVKELNASGYYDFANEKAFHEVGLDLKTDWSDSLHLRKDGAEKFSVYLARMLEQGGLQPSENADRLLWQVRVSDFYDIDEGGV